MARKTKTERIAEIEANIEQLHNQKRQLEAQERERARKERTKRLIERGAILESILTDAESLTNEQVKSILERALSSQHSQKMPSQTRLPQTPPLTADDEDTEENEG